MRTFLHDLTLLAAVTAAAAIALIRTTPPEPSAASPADGPSHIASAPQHAPISFSALALGEEIRVHFTSRGCYHDFEQDFVFTPAPDGNVALAHRVRRANLVEGWSLIAPSRLSGPQMAELDSLVAYFRAPYPLPNGRYCRAQEIVEIALYRHGHEVAMERFNGTCGSPDEEALTFGRLTRLTRTIDE